VLSLIVTHRHEICLIKKDVRRHQHGIVKQADADVFLLLARLVFVLRHALEFRHAGDAVQNPRQFSVFGNVGLYEDCRDLRIDPDGQIDPRKVSRLFRQ
jgi:hypothetical protein